MKSGNVRHLVGWLLGSLERGIEPALEANRTFGNDEKNVY